MGAGKGKNRRVAVTQVRTARWYKTLGMKYPLKDATVEYLQTHPETMRRFVELSNEIEAQGLAMKLHGATIINPSEPTHSFLFEDGHTSLISKRFCDCDCSLDTGQEFVCGHMTGHIIYEFVLRCEQFDDQQPVLELLRKLKTLDNLAEAREIHGQIMQQVQAYVQEQPKTLQKTLAALKRSGRGEFNSPANLLKKIKEGEINDETSSSEENYSDFVNATQTEKNGEKLTLMGLGATSGQEVKVCMFRENEGRGEYKGFNPILTPGLTTQESDTQDFSFYKAAGGDGLLIINFKAFKGEDTEQLPTVFFAHYESAKQTLRVNCVAKYPAEHMMNRERDLQEYVALLYPLMEKANEESYSAKAKTPHLSALKSFTADFHATEKSKIETRKAHVRALGSMTGAAQKAAENASQIKTVVWDSPVDCLKTWEAQEPNTTVQKSLVDEEELVF